MPTYDDMTISDVFGDQPQQPIINSGPRPDAPGLAENLTYLRSEQQPSVEDVAQIRAEQERALMQHAEYAQGLTERQDQVNLRQGDLDLAQRMMPVFDTQLNKLARMQLWRETARYLGVDPRSETVKDMGRTIIGLDPETSSRVRAAFSQRLTSAQPGQGIDFGRAIMGGQVGMYDLMRLVQQTPAPAMQFDPEGDDEYWMQNAGDDPQMAQVGGEPETTAPVAPQQSVIPQSLPGVQVTESEARTPYTQRQAHPGLVEMFGLDPNVAWNNKAIIERGYTGHYTQAGQQRFIEERDKAATSTLQLMLYGAQREALVRDNPEALDLSFGGYTIAPNPGRLTNEVRGALEGLNDTVLRIFGRRNMAAEAKRQRAEDRATSELGEISERNMQLDGNRNAMAVALAGVRGQRGAGLSDNEARRAEREISGSTDPNTVIAGVRGVLGRAFDSYSVFTSGVIREGSGVTARLNTSGLSPRDVDLLLSSSVIPQGLRDQLLAQREATRTQAPATSPQSNAAQQPPASTATQQPPAQQPPTQSGSEYQRQLDDAQRQRDADRDLARRTNQAQLTGIEQRTEINRRQEERQEEAYQRGTPYQRLQQARADAERSQARLQSAIQSAVRALSSVSAGGSSGGSSNVGGDQDASAFRIAPRPQRSAPTPAPAQSGYGNVRRRRGAGGV